MASYDQPSFPAMSTFAGREKKTVSAARPLFPGRAVENSAGAGKGSTERLNVVIVGHVGHGKSTLIGRLLFDTGSLPQGKAEAICKACAAQGVEFEYAFLTDALHEERERNLAIDAPWMSFHSASRDYAIIDAPGHAELLRNVVTGAARVSSAVVLIDSFEGVREQPRQHALLLELLGVSQFIVLINKMDLSAYGEERYRELVGEYRGFLTAAGLSACHFIPIAAKHGDNIAVRSARMPWWTGPTVIDALDAFEATETSSGQPLRMFVHDVHCSDGRRIIAGRVEAGVLRVGGRIAFTPGGRASVVKSIERRDTPSRDFAEAGENIGITLTDQILVERGTIASGETDVPCEGQQFKGRIFWMAETPLLDGRSYRLRLGTQDVPAEVVGIDRIVDATTLAQIVGAAVRGVQRHEVAEITIRTSRPVAFDDSRKSLVSGRFVLADGESAVGCGIILSGDYFQRVAGGPVPVENLFWATGKVTTDARSARNGHDGCVLWFTGLSGAGKSTIAIEVERQLFNTGRHVYVLDGDNLRHGLCAGLGFSAEDRRENIRRAAEAAKLFADAGVICLAAFISPLRLDRERARRLLPVGKFIEVHVATPIEVCKQRDPKGLYVRAERGEIRDFTGVSAPYEPPEQPEIVLHADRYTVSECVAQVLEYLAKALRESKAE